MLKPIGLVKMWQNIGGDDYSVFVGARNAYDFGPSLDEALQQYIEAFGPVSPQLEGRITQVGDSAEQPPATLPQSGGVGGMLPAIIMSLAGLSMTGAGVWLRRKK